MKTNFHGTGVAIVTPFNKDFSVDYIALEKLVEYQISNGTDYIVALGTTSEAATLNAVEKQKVVDTIVSRVNGRVPIVLGIGGNNTYAVCEEIKNNTFDGISAILSVVPYYNKPSQKGIFEHYNAIAEVSPIPIILYNVPGRTGTNMTAETTLKLAHMHPSIVAVKEASGDLVQTAKIVQNAPENFVVISGEDGLTVPLMSMGAKGVISVCSNCLPSAMSKMVNLCLENNFEEAGKIQRNITHLVELLFQEGNPVGAKAALSSLNMMENILRLPLVSSSDKLYSEMSIEIEKTSAQ